MLDTPRRTTKALNGQFAAGFGTTQSVVDSQIVAHRHATTSQLLCSTHSHRVADRCSSGVSSPSYSIATQYDLVIDIVINIRLTRLLRSYGAEGVLRITIQSTFHCHRNYIFIEIPAITLALLTFINMPRFFTVSEFDTI